AVNLQGVERTALERGDVMGAPGTLVASVLVDGTLELLRDAPRPLKARDRVRFHTGTSEIMARVLLLDRAALAPGESTYARFRLERRLVALPGGRPPRRRSRLVPPSGDARAPAGRRPPRARGLPPAEPAQVRHVARGAARPGGRCRRARLQPSPRRPRGRGRRQVGEGQGAPGL